MSTASERARGYFSALDDVMNFINALDSGDMDARQVRSTIYGYCLEARPTALSRPIPKDDAVQEFEKELRGVLADCSEFAADIGNMELADRAEAMLSQVVAEQQEADAMSAARQGRG